MGCSLVKSMEVGKHGVHFWREEFWYEIEIRVSDSQILEGSENDAKELGTCLIGAKDLVRVSEWSVSGSPVHHHV